MDNSPESAPVREGDVLASKYRVERVLGVGGMGVVVAAHHLHLNQRVALKFLLRSACANPEAVGRFLREAQSAVRIQNEHVARVLDVGTLEGGEPYMVMEFLAGKDLGQVLESRGPLPIGEAVDYLLQACEAIAEAHALGIVHRDLKPANLFLTARQDGTPFIKVLDFGISKATRADGQASDSQSLTATTAVMGSPLYMSPEQVKSAKGVDHRTDIWALGVILHELLSGGTAFAAETIGGLFIAIASEPPVPLRTVRADAPPELEAIIQRCLEKSPAKRVQNVAELATALFPFAPKGARGSIERISRVIQASGLGTSAPSLPASQAPPGPVAASTAGASTAAAWSAGEPPRRSRSLGLAIGAAVLVLGAAGALLLRNGSGVPIATTSSGSSLPGAAVEPSAPPATTVTPPTVTPEVASPVAAPPTVGSSPPAASVAPPPPPAAPATPLSPASAPRAAATKATPRVERKPSASPQLPPVRKPVDDGMSDRK